MRRRTLLPLLIVALLLLAAGGIDGGMACATIPEDIGLANGRFRPCPFSPNCVNSEAKDDPSAIEPLEYSGDGPRAFRSLLDFIEAQPEVELVTSEADYAHFVFRTGLLRFRDDVELRLDREASVVHVRSASRVGFSDLGTNRRRIERIRRSWSPPVDSEF